MTEMTQIEFWTLTYIPYAIELERTPFNSIVDILGEAVDEDTMLLTCYGDIIMGGTLDKEIRFSTSKAASSNNASLKSFQDDLAALIGRAGFQGNLYAQRYLTIMQAHQEEPDEQ